MFSPVIFFFISYIMPHILSEACSLLAQFFQNNLTNFRKKISCGGMTKQLWDNHYNYKKS